MGSCHHNMAHPKVSDGEMASIYVWQVAANILNKPIGGGYFTRSRTWTDPLVCCKQWKRDMKFSTWNVRSLCRLGTLVTVARELARYRLNLVGAQKARWGKRGTVQAENYSQLISQLVSQLALFSMDPIEIQFHMDVEIVTM